jgi:hypothetical protein
MKTGYKMPDLATQQINELLLDDMNRITKKFDSMEIHIYNINLQKVILAEQKVIEHRERLIKEANGEIIRLKKAIKHVDILQRAIKDVEIQQKDAELKRAINDVEILQNINLGHQKTIEEKDAQLKRAINDAEY